LCYHAALLNVGKVACIVFLAGLAFVCYRQPIDNLDRYIYEAIVRGKSQPIEAVYSIVKHESPRAEQSSVLDGPRHLQELEPMYTIRPVYLMAISLLSRVFPIQKTITLVSATALFGIGIIVLLWTKQPLMSALLMAAWPILTIGRLGTPDALATLLIVSALWLLDREKTLALGLLFVALGVRTDNLLVLLAVLAWLTWEKRLPRSVAGALAAIAIGIVLGINHWAGNYGWVVLIRSSFISFGYPAQESHTLTLREYATVFTHGAYGLASLVALWLLMAILAWRRRPSPLLIVVGCAAAVHFVLYPSPEDRYLVWAYVVSGVALIRSFEDETENVRMSL
jgi:hypothetical protein